jgi:hypothetical protein
MSRKRFEDNLWISCCICNKPCVSFELYNTEFKAPNLPAPVPTLWRSLTGWALAIKKYVDLETT